MLKTATRGMITPNRIKHALHCMGFLFVIIFMMKHLVSFAELKSKNADAWKTYGPTMYTMMVAIRLLVLLALPQVVLNFLGLICFNAFPEKVTLKGSSLLTPLICIRIVTRGDYPQLVRDNVARNMARCSEAGMDNFLIEVVTDKMIGLPNHRRIREIVIPSTYTPKSGAKYKARALQYCLEDGVNILADNDYIVHLDEETIMTVNSIRGIVNFILDGKYDFGQGLITYANDKIVNWTTTLADSIRVADDMGKLRAQFYFFHKPILSWKGSFIVSRVEAEKRVSFDNGMKGSLAEDCYFAMKAYQLGCTFNFIDGDMWEKSPFTIRDYIEQRKRWIQGLMLVVISPEISWRYKFWLSMSLYAWITIPLTLSNIFLSFFFPIPMPIWLNCLCIFIGSVNLYMYFFGTIKSISVYRIGVCRYSLCLVSVIYVVLIATIMENIAVIKSVFGSKKAFYIVKKDSNNLIVA
ncbi:beta-1,4-mannosyltransferase egh-like [Planococcus citri]|uniref:beta-1,4-mannosyltransferase egh-like n=1 Tax=Planococcus citri TaxID=170843 RepID=UPI0031F9885A